MNVSFIDILSIENKTKQKQSIDYRKTKNNNKKKLSLKQKGWNFPYWRSWPELPNLFKVVIFFFSLTFKTNFSALPNLHEVHQFWQTSNFSQSHSARTFLVLCRILPWKSGFIKTSKYEQGWLLITSSGLSDGG